MTHTIFKNICAFMFGGLFSIGLLLSGLSNPEKVIGFLDFFGQWDPSLAFVMLGAIMVVIFPMQMAIRKPITVFKQSIELPTKQQIDRKLIIGAVLFGIGWGISGICPAPSFTLIGLGYGEGLYFIVAMGIGVWVYGKIFGAS
ncbi:hypothetical protein EC844_13417 [Acinetobacter calcoaceticus]|uniref:YeeE/YedE family protein n=1 Tax=Acinetobacter calcoaceticus TaxID=471 RepID=A0A4R1XBJ7_ACICA|nr:hypothetical protein EC844_13417 [Acinetobacter calcoaceticus]